MVVFPVLHLNDVSISQKAGATETNVVIPTLQTSLLHLAALIEEIQQGNGEAMIQEEIGKVILDAVLLGEVLLREEEVWGGEEEVVEMEIVEKEKEIGKEEDGEGMEQVEEKAERVEREKEVEDP